MSWPSELIVHESADRNFQIAAAIIEYSSYRIALHAMGGAFGLALIMIFFWMPESAYAREALNIDTGDTNVNTPSLSDFYPLH